MSDEPKIPPAFDREDYIGYSNGMVHYTHGSYRLEDIVRMMYPDPDDPRRTAVMLAYSGY